MSRILDGAEIPAAEQAFALLIQRIAAIAAEGRLALTVEVAANSCGRLRMLHPYVHFTARLRKVEPPSSAVLEQIRSGAMQSILNSEPKG
ncbi:hypothetical protein [Paenibacillus dokdonensis]|uniref:hypothetical protein n=1 Tax=Paenibacillus dokdonensis TaxID=2567944 RepID=UPI001B3C75C4|nr:hypothetical protein [Paenibacillus dokdonensis]